MLLLAAIASFVKEVIAKLPIIFSFPPMRHEKL
jgi:hypothetical protein